MTDKLRAAAEMALNALESWQKTCLDCGRTSEELGRATKPIQPLRQALAEPDMGIDRGAWSDVPDATKWVDELRGDEEPPNSTTDVVEPEEWDHPPHRNCECKHCTEYWSDVYPNKGNVCGNE